ncbi:MAG TPA: flagellar hook protein FlgE [Candidatus Angelobacter sp.]|nr:flagellar hook protein FlgE [Candidatus Angelobacter sp.]
MPLFSIPLSGLNAASSELSVISNNLANLNTTGYKDQETSFRDLFYQTMGSTGGGDAIQIGSGAGVESVTSNFNNGSPDNTGVPTDMAITGNGFFVTQQNGVTQYTRAGNFTVSKAGILTTQDGQAVMGYPATGGVVNAGTALAPLQVGSGLTNPANATTSVTLNANLNADTNVGDPAFSTPATVYDSLGTPHVLSFQFSKTAANTWSYQVTIPAADTGSPGPNPTVISGPTTLAFDSSGNLTSPASNVAGITVSGLADGAADLNFSWDLYDSNGAPTLTQMAAPSATASTQQNGYSSGTLQGFNVDSAGVLQGTFSNGQVVALGQIAIASFANQEGLQLTGSNGYVPTLASGAAVVGAPGSAGRGNITGGSLELSNVDVSQEFANLIIAQRGYEANAKVVTTFDTIAQDTISLIR